MTTDSELEMPWLDDAACLDMTLGDFFVAPGKTITEEVEEVCKGCPVRVDCLSHAYDWRIEHGYFGGLSPAKRSSMTKDDALELLVEMMDGRA